MHRGKTSCHRRAVSRAALGLAIAALVLATSAAPPAVAQEDGRPDVDQFGGFIASARSNAVSITYDLHGLLPVSPIVDVAVPDALATINSGPVGYGLASLAFPGPLLANLADALAVGGTDAPIPEWPIRAEAFYPSGPRETETGGGGTTMSAITDFADSRVQSSFAGLDVPPVISVGGVEAKSQSTIEDDLLVARTRSVVTDLAILGGLIRIDSVTTDLIAVSNGAGAASGGTTSVAGASVLGLPVHIDGDGIHFSEDDADHPPGGGENGGIFDFEDLLLPPELGDTLDDLAAGLNDLLGVAGGTVGDLFAEVFELTGIEITVGTPTESVDGGTAVRNASGMSIIINYDGSNTPLITDLLGLFPTELLPDENLGPIPFSPQALVVLLSETHITGVHVAPGSVSAQATEAFVVDIPPFDIDTAPSAAPSPPPPPPVSGTIEPAFTPDFTSPVPELPQTQVVSSQPASRPLLFGLGLPALILLVLAAGVPFFAIGGTRLAGTALATSSRGCPFGLDQPNAAPE